MAVSILIPCFNSESFLAPAIESALAQTRPADEVLVVDDGSTDGSRDVAARYPVRTVQLPENRGPATARNVAIREARGDTLVWLDADDRFEPRHVEVVVGLLERYPAAAVAFSAVRLEGGLEGIWGTLAACRGQPADIFWSCLAATVVPPMSAAVRRRALAGIGGYDERFRYSEDFDLWLRLSRRELFVSTDEVTARYRRHPRQASVNRRAQQQAVYESRRLLLSTLEHEGEADLAARVAGRMERIWEAELEAAWDARDFPALRATLALAPLLPRADAAARYRRRARIPPPLLALVDRARPLLGMPRRARTRRASGGADRPPD